MTTLYLTPNEIITLLEFHVRGEAHFLNIDSPQHETVRLSLTRKELVSRRVDVADPTNDGQWQLTERGEVMVKMLTGTPLPVQVWVSP